MKKLLYSIVENIGLIIGLVFFVAIIDLVGLGGKADIGLGFIFGILLIIVVFILNYTGKWAKIKEYLKPKEEVKS